MGTELAWGEGAERGTAEAGFRTWTRRADGGARERLCGPRLASSPERGAREAGGVSEPGLPCTPPLQPARPLPPTDAPGSKCHCAHPTGTLGSGVEGQDSASPLASLTPGPVHPGPEGVPAEVSSFQGGCGSLLVAAAEAAGPLPGREEPAVPAPAWASALEAGGGHSHLLHRPGGCGGTESPSRGLSQQGGGPPPGEAEGTRCQPRAGQSWEETMVLAWRPGTAPAGHLMVILTSGLGKKGVGDSRGGPPAGQLLDGRPRPLLLPSVHLLPHQGGAWLH